MSHYEKSKFEQIQKMLDPTLTIYTEIIQNQQRELDLDLKKFWIDNPLITTYDYIRMLDHYRQGVQPSTR